MPVTLVERILAIKILRPSGKLLRGEGKKRIKEYQEVSKLNLLNVR